MAPVRTGLKDIFSYLIYIPSVSPVFCGGVLGAKAGRERGVDESFVRQRTLLGFGGIRDQTNRVRENIDTILRSTAPPGGYIRVREVVRMGGSNSGFDATNDHANQVWQSTSSTLVVSTTLKSARRWPNRIHGVVLLNRPAPLLMRHHRSSFVFSSFSSSVPLQHHRAHSSLRPPLRLKLPAPE